MKEFQNHWKRAALIALAISIVCMGGGLVTGSRMAWGVAAGFVPGEVDLIGLGLRLPLWARLTPRAAVVGLNLRLLSRLLLVGVYFYILHHYTVISVPWALVGLFVPHAVYLVDAIWQQRGKEVSG